MSRRVIISVTNDLSIDQRVHRVATALHEAGYAVLVVGRKRSDSVPLDARQYETKRLRLLFERGKFFYLEYAFRLFWWLIFRKFDILLSNDMDTLLPNFWAARMRRKKLVYDSHEYWTEVPELIGRKRTRGLWLWLEKRLFPKADAVMTVNQSLADIYSQTYKVPVHALRNVPDRKAEMVSAETPGKDLLYQGTLNVGRGLELMIETMGHLPEYRLTIVGIGPLEAALRKQAADSNYADRISFAGFIPMHELAGTTCKATLGMSLEEDLGASYRVASPNKVFDYIQSGVPVLVSALPEMENLVERWKVGAVLPANGRSAELLAVRIRKICEDERQWKSYRAACLAAAETLCWDQEKAILLDLFTQL